MTQHPFTSVVAALEAVERTSKQLRTDLSEPQIEAFHEAIELLADAATAARQHVKRAIRHDAILEREWREKLETAVARVPKLRRLVRVAVVLDFFDVHELYTVLVDPSGEPESCCAGCTRLPPGWCPSCDEQRKAEN